MGKTLIIRTFTIHSISLFFNLFVVELPTTGKKMYVDPSNYDKPEDAIVEFATEIDATLLYLEMLIGKGENIWIVPWQELFHKQWKITRK